MAVLHGAEQPPLQKGQQQGPLQLVKKGLLIPGLRHLRIIGSKKFRQFPASHTHPSRNSLCDRFHFDPFSGTEELGHLEMVGALVHQLTRNLKDSQIQDSAFAPYFVDHTNGVYPNPASGGVYNTGMLQVKGDPMADLCEDLGAEQKARVTYDNILRLSDDPDVNNVIKFLRQREIVHFQRFGEAVELLRQKLNEKNVYYMNPAFDI